MSKDSEKKVSFDVDKKSLNRFTSELALAGVKPSNGLRALINVFLRDNEVQDKVISACQKAKK